MKEVIKYVSVTGTEFNTKEECIEHENNYEKACEIIGKLEPIPINDNCSFANGSGYVQHNINNVISVRNEFLEFIKHYTTFKWIQETIDNPQFHLSWATRAIGDSCCPHIIYGMWARFTCIDSLGREWGQQYYANNPDKGVQTRLN